MNLGVGSYTKWGSTDLTSDIGVEGLRVTSWASISNILYTFYWGEASKASTGNTHHTWAASAKQNNHPCLGVISKGPQSSILTSRLVTKSSHVFCKRWEWVTCALHYRLAAMELQSKYVYLHTHKYIYIYIIYVCVWVSCSRGIKCNYTLIIISIMKDILTCNYITILYSHIEPRWNSPQGVRATIL